MVESLAALRHRRFSRHPCYRADDDAQAAMTRALAESIDALNATTGELAVLGGPSHPRAYVLWWDAPEMWFGAPGQNVWLDYADDAAIDWVCATLDRIPKSPHLNLHLDILDRPVRDHLLCQDIGVDSVMLVGQPEAALRGLLADRKAPELPRDLTLAPLTPEDIDAAVELSRQVFTAEPQYCWFGANPKRLSTLRRELTEDGPGLCEAVYQDNQLVGWWRTDVQPNPYWGLAAGLELILAPHIRGRGLARLAYQRMLERQLELNVETFKGGTAQPPVLHLARKMGRTPVQTWLRRQSWFPPEHFGLPVRDSDGNDG